MTCEWHNRLPRHPSAGCRGDVEMMTPIATRFGSVSSSENGPEMCRESSRKRGAFRSFYKSAPRFEKTREIPRLTPGVGGSEIRTSKKKDLFFTEVFHPPYEALEPPNNRCDKSPRFVDRLGPPRDNIFVSEIVATRLRTDSLREIYSFLSFVRLRHPPLLSSDRCEV